LRSGSLMNSSGSALTPKVARLNQKLVWPATKKWPPRPSALRNWTLRKFKFHQDPDWVSRFWKPKTSRKGFGDRVLINNLSFSLPRNGIVGIIGPNGVGKSTLFKTIVGIEPLDGGELIVGESVKLSYVDQERGGIDSNKTLWEVVSDGLDVIQVGKWKSRLAHMCRVLVSRDPTSRKRLGCCRG
jgi:ATPase subunit of ABC transporter with duplicated ATPase domains